jgi:hypothetical protein
MTGKSTKKRAPKRLSAADVDFLNQLVAWWEKKVPGLSLKPAYIAKRWRGVDWASSRAESVRLGYLLSSAAAQRLVIRDCRVLRLRDSGGGWRYKLELVDPGARDLREVAMGQRGGPPRSAVVQFTAELLEVVDLPENNFGWKRARYKLVAGERRATELEFHVDGAPAHMVNWEAFRPEVAAAAFNALLRPSEVNLRYPMENKSLPHLPPLEFRLPPLEDGGGPIDDDTTSPANHPPALEWYGDGHLGAMQYPSPSSASPSDPSMFSVATWERWAYRRVAHICIYPGCLEPATYLCHYGGVCSGHRHWSPPKKGNTP